MKARKSYGQHFLIEPGAAERIADLLVDHPNIEQIVEVGPGMGALTKHLLPHSKRLIAVEADKHLLPFLFNHYGQYPNLKIVHANFLKLELNEQCGDDEFIIIGNFPYNISSQIIFKLIEYRAQCPALIGMFQKELADRLIAEPGSKTYGVISALVQLFYTGERIFNLDPGAFNPPPKVKSTVIRLNRKEHFPKVDYKKYRTLVKLAFGQRRKKMRNTIGHMFSKETIKSHKFFQERPEQLSVEDFIELVQMAK